MNGKPIFSATGPREGSRSRKILRSQPFTQLPTRLHNLRDVIAPWLQKAVSDDATSATQPSPNKNCATEWQKNNACTEKNVHGMLFHTPRSVFVHTNCSHSDRTVLPAPHYHIAWITVLKFSFGDFPKRDQFTFLKHLRSSDNNQKLKASISARFKYKSAAL